MGLVITGSFEKQDPGFELLARVILLCSWAIHFTHTVLLVTAVYKWVPATCWYFNFRMLMLELHFFPDCSCFVKHAVHPLVCCTHLILMHCGKLQETACMLHYYHCFMIFLHLLLCCFWQLLIRDGTTFQLL